VAKRSKDGPQARRLLALAAIYEGASRGEAARIASARVIVIQCVSRSRRRLRPCRAWMYGPSTAALGGLAPHALHGGRKFFGSRPQLAR
jgi:hypothetical protein